MTSPNIASTAAAVIGAPAGERGAKEERKPSLLRTNTSMRSASGAGAGTGTGAEAENKQSVARTISFMDQDRSMLSGAQAAAASSGGTLSSLNLSAEDDRTGVQASSRRLSQD